MKRIYKLFLSCFILFLAISTAYDIFKYKSLICEMRETPIDLLLQGTTLNQHPVGIAHTEQEKYACVGLSCELIPFFLTENTLFLIFPDGEMHEYRNRTATSKYIDFGWLESHVGVAFLAWANEYSTISINGRMLKLSEGPMKNYSREAFLNHINKIFNHEH